MASTCEHTHGASAPRPRRAAVRAGSHHAPASAAISASAWPPRARPQLVTSLKRRPTKISEQNRKSKYEMHHPADAKNALTKPLALISFCYCFVSRFRQGRFFRRRSRSRTLRDGSERKIQIRFPRLTLGVGLTWLVWASRPPAGPFVASTPLSVCDIL